MTEHKILEKFDISKEENAFLDISENSSTSKINYTRVVSNFYLSKTIEISVKEIIKSNKGLSESNEKYTKGMLWLTGGLIFIGLADIITQVFLKFYK